MRLARLFWLMTAVLCCGLPTGVHAAMRPVDLSCEEQTDPLGIDTAAPRLSWRLEGDGRGLRQTAYRILVASSAEVLEKGEGDLWDSGRVASDQSRDVEYRGRPLTSRQRCFWKVQAWDQDEKSSPWSEAAQWTMGLLHRGDWQAEWIGSDLELLPHQRELKALPDFGMEDESVIWGMADRLRAMGNSVREAPAVQLRREFTSPKPVRRATVSLCGLGLYELSINGRRVGDHQLDPIYTDYQRRVCYQTYDVTVNVREGANAVGVILGNGWYNLITPHVLRYYAADYIDTPRLLLRLDIEYADGSHQTVSSDGGWKFTTDGPIRFNCVLAGETYDARREMPGWDRPGFDASRWQPARVLSAPEGRLATQTVPPVRRLAEWPARSVVKQGDRWRFDLGVDNAGHVRIKVRGTAGRKITLVHPGANSHTLGRYQVDEYVLKGGGPEVFEPRFCYHGFRYVDVLGLEGRPQASDVTGIQVGTDLTPAGRFECSYEPFNHIQEIFLRTLHNYVIHLPNDPVREKAGWDQDIWNQFECTAYNFDCRATYAEWQRDLIEEQHPNGYVPPVVPSRFDGPTINGPWWGGSIVYNPWLLYRFYGDRRLLHESYPAMKRQTDYLDSIAKDGVVSWGLGDWLEVGSVRPVMTPVPFTSTAAYAWFTRLVARSAEITGRKEEAAQFLAKAERLDRSFHRQFYDAKTGIYAKGSQTSEVLPLALGLTPADEIAKVRQRLAEAVLAKQDHLSTGFVGTPILLTGLCDNGLGELAWRIATRPDYPGWFDMLFNRGNTVMIEMWDGNGVQMPSLGGPISAWFYRSLAGICPDPENPGFKHVIVRPSIVGELNWVKAHHDSPYGRISVSWKREGDRLTMDVAIPPNTTATVYVPTSRPNEVTESGKPVREAVGVKFQRAEGDRAVLDVQSGHYHFSAPLEKREKNGETR
ncbi:MAG: family 78 glycoside hydrolase catalytic domain [Thermoguttaceae bacterium]